MNYLIDEAVKSFMLITVTVSFLCVAAAGAFSLVDIVKHHDDLYVPLTVLFVAAASELSW